MRGIMLRALPVLLLACATGCFLTGGRSALSHPPTPTHAYWQQASMILAEKPLSGDMPAQLALVGRQTDALGKLSPEGVDPTLVAAVQEVIRSEQRVLELAANAGNKEEVLRATPGVAQTFGEANKAAAEAKKRLKALRGPLSEQYGRGFAQMN
jgi:hypothetical protein